MPNKFEILFTNIFPKNKIIAGVTKRNLDLFTPHGFSISNGDILTDEQVNENRKSLANRLGLPFKNLKFQKQIHGTNIQIVDQSTPNNNQSDGMITNEPEIILNISIADCSAILMFDPVNNAIGAFHSGWRGTKENIASKGINLINETYESNPKELLVYLSPCASGKRYEVGWDVAQYFPDSITQFRDEKYLFDNQKQIVTQLLNAGIPKNNIEASDICTIENTEYHSYRRDKEKSGRMSAFIGLI